ncbi:MAG: tRNA (adenosine(37)-N6)-dimethylallyltransferase MiaA [Crocinitomicaceae bacterium]
MVQGATASGKTGLSIDIAKFFGAEIISADSRQIFKELNIGVARPAANELSEVKHHFIASHSILDEMTAASFANAARELIQNYFIQKDVLVLVGGSGLYVDVLLNGIDNLPRDAKLKAEINKQFNEKGISFLKEEIVKLDSNALDQVDVNNSRRLLRILEILKITGDSLQNLKTGELNPISTPYHRFCIEWKREDLYSRINARVDEMVQLGLEKEVLELEKYSDLTPLKTVGYQEWYGTNQDKTGVVEKIKQHTRNYAKRQLTWLRRYDNLIYLNPYSEITLFKQVMSELENNGMILEKDTSE